MARTHVFNSPTAGTVPGGVKSTTPARGSAGKRGGLLGDRPATVLPPKLQEQWKRHPRPGLKVRHETGKFLNGQFGPPTRGDHEAVFQSVASAFPKGTDESDLSMMRWFAHYFKDAEALKASYPRANKWSWDRVRKCVACLEESRSVPPRGAQAGPPEVRVRELTKQVRSVIHDIAGLDERDFWKHVSDWYVMLSTVDQMLKAVSMHFQTHVWGNIVFDLMKKV